MKPAIVVEDLGKMYRLGKKQPSVINLSERISNGLRSLKNKLSRNDEAYNEFWALKDINFSINHGEVVGIIGRNGAGKSTLLKILSRIVEPTTGKATVRGRLGSLLEVGTGFHPELTGRENIYLNGSILGMRRIEIQQRFDDIVEFSEISEFLDTPVKRYSSGMYVRLAFAVAAHLNPEILIVDEVLAVGDMAFQKKCIGKMSEVASKGRTVLFVSHNLQTVSQLTTKTIILDRGQVMFQGSTPEGIGLFSNLMFKNDGSDGTYSAPSDKKGTYIKSAAVKTSEPFNEHICKSGMVVSFSVAIDESQNGFCFSFQILNESDEPVCHFWMFDKSHCFATGGRIYHFNCVIPSLKLFMGKYTLATYLSDRKSVAMHEILRHICPFEVTMRGIEREEYNWRSKDMIYWEDFSWSEITSTAQ